MNITIENKVALVTGAAPGLGLDRLLRTATLQTVQIEA
jgi:hypothetical protein